MFLSTFSAHAPSRARTATSPAASTTRRRPASRPSRSRRSREVPGQQRPGLPHARAAHQGAARRAGEAPPLGAVDRLLQAAALREVPPAARPVQRGDQAGRRRRRQGRADPASPSSSSARSRRSRRSSGRPSRARSAGTGWHRPPGSAYRVREEPHDVAHRARRGSDGAVSARAAGGRLQGGPAARRGGLRRRPRSATTRAARSSRSRTSSSPSTTAPCPSWARPRCAGRRRRSSSPAGPYELRRTVVSVRVNPTSPYRVAADDDGVLGLYLDGQRDRRRRGAAHAGVLPAHALQREVGDGGRPHHPVGLPDLPDRLPGLPVLRRQGGVPVLRHQPQLAPAQGGRPALHRGQGRRGGARGPGDHRPVRHRRRRPRPTR